MSDLTYPVPPIAALKTETLVNGSGGRAVKAGDNIKTRVKGVLASGKQFWATGSPGARDEFFSTDIGAGKLIQGFDQGVLGMTEGEKRRIMIPWAMGYGANGMPPTIPAKADLIFEVEVVAFN